MAEFLADPRRADEVRAVDPDGALVLDDRRVADRTALGHGVLALGAGPAIDDGPDDLRDDVAGLLEDHPVADPDVLAPDLVEVVEGRSRDRRAGDLDRGHVGDRRQRPRPPDVRDDVLDERLDLFGRELEGDGPAGRPADHAETGLLVEPVDLDDDAVGLVRQGVASLAPALGERDDALDVEVRLAVGVDREAEPGQSLEGGRLCRDDLGVLDQLVEPGRQLAAGRDGRVDLPERTGAAVARIGIQRESRLFALLVDAPELGLGHEHLAACVERGGLGQPGRDHGDGPQVGRHVLAGRAVAAGRALAEPAAVVMEADGEPVDLEFGDVAQLGGRFRRRRQARGPCGRACRTHAARRG